MTSGDIHSETFSLEGRPELLALTGRPDRRLQKIRHYGFLSRRSNIDLDDVRAAILESQGGPTIIGRVPQAQDALPSALNIQGDVQLQWDADGEASCRSATRPDGRATRRLELTNDPNHGAAVIDLPFKSDDDGRSRASQVMPTWDSTI